MFNIKTSAQLKGETHVQTLLEDLKLMVEGYLDNEDYHQLCKECGIQDDDFTAFMNGNVCDMSLQEFYRIVHYIDDIASKYSEDMEDYSVEPIEGHEEAENRGDHHECCCGDSCCCDHCECEKLNDDKFITNVNKTLKTEPKINKKETLKAKDLFNEDIKVQMLKDYDIIAKKAMRKLFHTTEDLNSLSNDRLRVLVMEHGLTDEIDVIHVRKFTVEIRQAMLRVLYHKLEQEIEGEIYKHYNVTKDDFSGDKKVNRY